MVSPIRVKGVKGHYGSVGGSLDPLDMSQVPEEGKQITYTSPQGEVWALHYPTVAESEVQRVVLKPGGLSGAVAKIEFDKQGLPGGWGERKTSRLRFPALGGSLQYTVTADVQRLAETDRDWRNAWSFDPDNPGRLTVVHRDGGNYWTPVIKTAETDLDHDLIGGRYYEDSLEWVGLDGCWYGPRRVMSGTFSYSPPGDFPPQLWLRWTGAATSVTFPSGAKLSFTAATDGVPRLIDLGFGMGGRVTVESTGVVDRAGWASLLGRVPSVTLTPHKPSSWVLGPGMSLVAVSRHASPWR